MDFHLEPAARLRFALDAADLGEWELDVGSGTLSCSGRSGAGLTPAERHAPWSLAAFLDRVHPEDRPRVRSALERGLEPAHPWCFECRLVLSGSQVRWIRVNGCAEREAGEIRRMYGIVQDITERKRNEAIAAGQQRALELAVEGAPLNRILDVLTRSAEEQAGGSILASVLLLDPDGAHLRFGSGPSLPQDYNRAIDGVAIGPATGSCGSAAFLGAPVIVSDIASDRRWDGYRQFALPHGLRACWSLPILSTAGKVLGTMASYCREVREPTDREAEAMALLVNTAALVIERARAAEERRVAEQALRTSEKRFRSLVHATSAIVWTTSPGAEFDAMQPGWAAFTGQTFEEMKGLGWLGALHPEDRAATLSRVRNAVQQAEPVYLEYRLRRGDGQYRYVNAHAVPIFGSDGTLREWAGFCTDVTESKQAEKRLHLLATHDPLTGLPNRVYLNEHLQELINFTPQGESVAVMLLDLDRFKQVNDSMGHESGDAMLRQVAGRFVAALPSGSLIARLGGDEFVVVAHSVAGDEIAREIAEKLVSAVALPVEVGGNEFFPGASIGISLYPAHGRTKEELIQHADIAMYRAKAAGGNCYRFFSAEMSAETKNRVVLEAALRSAVENREFVVHYQPRLRLPAMGGQGVEALIRWNHPTRGLVPPQDFIPIAEETGLIGELGHWVLKKACSDIAELGRRLGRPLRLSVNLSPWQLKSPQLVQQTRQALERAGMPAELLELELTEGAFIEDMAASAHVLRELKALGVRLAVDDFGTGYSGLSYLRGFPIDTVKLDRSFVTQPGEGIERRYSFIKAITDMAHALDLDVVAEGVEDAETLDLLRRVMCDEAQGYLFARPLPLEELLSYLSSQAGA